MKNTNSTFNEGYFHYSSMLDAQMKFLEGKLLTIIDATESDKEKREATKSLVKAAIREQFNHMQTFSFTPYEGPTSTGNKMTAQS